MQIIIDKDLSTERTLEADRVSERPLTKRLTAYHAGLTAEGVPELAPFTAEAFSSVAVKRDDGEDIALAGEYHRIEDLSVTYEDGGRSYFLNLALSGEEASAE